MYQRLGLGYMFDGPSLSSEFVSYLYVFVYICTYVDMFTEIL